MNILCFGEPLIRFATVAHERLDEARTMEISYSGAESVVAVTLAQFGEQVSFASKLSNNRLGTNAIMNLARYGVAEREEIDVRWALGCIRLSKRMRQLEAALAPAQCKMAQFKIYQALYLSLEWEKPYLPQLEQALCALDAYLDKAAARAVQKP